MFHRKGPSSKDGDTSPDWDGAEADEPDSRVVQFGDATTTNKQKSRPTAQRKKKLLLGARTEKTTTAQTVLRELRYIAPIALLPLLFLGFVFGSLYTAPSDYVRQVSEISLNHGFFQHIPSNLTTVLKFPIGVSDDPAQTFTVVDAFFVDSTKVDVIFYQVVPGSVDAEEAYATGRTTAWYEGWPFQAWCHFTGNGTQGKSFAGLYPMKSNGDLRYERYIHASCPVPHDVLTSSTSAGFPTISLAFEFCRLNWSVRCDSLFHLLFSYSCMLSTQWFRFPQRILQTLPALPIGTKQSELSIVTVVHNDRHVRVLPEFLAFHDMIGVAHFYILVDPAVSNATRFLAATAKQNNKGKITLIEDSTPIPHDPDWPSHPRDRSLAAQLSAVLNRVRHRTIWLSFLYPNEFIWIRYGHSLFDELDMVARKSLSVVFLTTYEFGARHEATEEELKEKKGLWLATQEFIYRSASPKLRGSRPILYTRRIGSVDTYSSFTDAHPHFPPPATGYMDMVRFHANAYLCVSDLRQQPCEDATNRYHRANMILDDTIGYLGQRLRSTFEAS